ncbi:MAG TPA: SUF system NifU family Fe-S cluster assembly protein [Candidatus Nanoarchaeia archaeon]|nr:SUF system NifU family Fe-S cluster assembly protein [Candidatus Nanoarchaeia archaeon]
MNQIYREQIMEHYRNPQNYGHLDSFSFAQKESNPFCGDEIELEVKLEGDRISDIKFSGSGCSISRASASMLTEFVKGKSLNDVKALKRDDILDLMEMPLGPVRIKCAVISLIALKNGIRIYEEKNGLPEN